MPYLVIMLFLLIIVELIMINILASVKLFFFFLMKILVAHYLQVYGRALDSA